MSNTSTPPSLHLDQSQSVKDFLQTYCLLSRDRFANKPIQLIDYQINWLDQFFGTGTWIDDDTFFKRYYQRSYLWLPRKNGKSSLMAGLSLFLAFEKHGNEVVVLAPSIKLAKIIFNEAAFMAQAHPSLKKIFWVRDHINTIVCKANNSVIKVLSGSNPASISGHNGDVLIDEITSLPPSTCNQIWGKLQSTGEARLNSCFITISHANYLMGEHIGYQNFLLSKQILEARERGEPDPDPQCLPVIFSADLDKVDDPEEWKRVNPGIPKILSFENLEADYKRAKANPREWNRFLLFRLNCFVGSSESYIPVNDYERAECDFDEKDLQNLDGIVWGLDLSRRRDLSVYVMLFHKDGLLYLIPRIFTPNDTLDRKSKEDKVDYRKWERDGHIITTPKDTIDQEFLMEHMLEDAKLFPPVEVRYDPHGADMLAKALTSEGITMAEAPCNRPSFLIPPTGELERAFMRGIVRVPKNPCMRWCFQNAVIKHIGADNIIVCKEKCTARVDATIASILAMSGYMAQQDVRTADIESGIFL